MKDEFTAKMHATFKVSKETDIKHRVWTASILIGKSKKNMEKYLDMYGVTKDQYEKYYRLFK